LHVSRSLPPDFLLEKLEGKKVPEGSSASVGI
jgi:hypothetical protein